MVKISDKAQHVQKVAMESPRTNNKRERREETQAGIEH